MTVRPELVEGLDALRSYPIRPTLRKGKRGFLANAMRNLKYWRGVSGISVKKPAIVLGFHKLGGVLLVHRPSNSLLLFVILLMVVLRSKRGDKLLLPFQGEIMRVPQSVKALEELGRVRLSKSFFMRDFLYSEIANFYGMQNVPEDPDLAIEVGKKLCEELLEPLNATFGRLEVRSAYRSPTVNAFGNEKGHSCASNESNYASQSGTTAIPMALKAQRLAW